MLNLILALTYLDQIFNYLLQLLLLNKTTNLTKSHRPSNSLKKDIDISLSNIYTHYLLMHGMVKVELYGLSSSSKTGGLIRGKPSNSSGRGQYFTVIKELQNTLRSESTWISFMKDRRAT